ncbi:hypothetical protein [Lactococcus garvieae]|uniref:Uncharacterized protein n=1 Tax=Lactococcus garvieae DCC43 TaxID=1231377 RepID=K2QCZ7_9LACT|nr:hypothetical protein [Lactococcus garvieae]EKF51337.1 hypothetical protein C426_1291 [Lactococcus garvieae DCC43]
MKNQMTEAEKTIANAPKEIREAHAIRIGEIRNKDHYKSRMAVADAKEVIGKFIVDVLSIPETKENSTMVAAIAKLAKVLN